jgi:hypothetical protein
VTQVRGKGGHGAGLGWPPHELGRAGWRGKVGQAGVGSGVGLAGLDWWCWASSGLAGQQLVWIGLGWLCWVGLS